MTAKGHEERFPPTLSVGWPLAVTAAIGVGLSAADREQPHLAGRATATSRSPHRVDRFYNSLSGLDDFSCVERQILPESGRHDLHAGAQPTVRTDWHLQPT